MPKKKSKKTQIKSEIEEKPILKANTPEENKANTANTNQIKKSEWENSNNDASALLGIHEPEDSIHRPLVFKAEEENK